MRRLTTEDINTLIERQLDQWPEARDNFFRLRDARRKPVGLGDLSGAVQHNPARIRSTGADIDAKSIAGRPCFLCAANRPAEQITVNWADGWELLVNPYPILPVHFTVVSTTHRPQSEIPLDMASMAEAAPDLVFFFNGARAGASAPDHMHVQAVLKDELPLIRLTEEKHHSGRGGFANSEEFGIKLPFQYISGVITPDREGMINLSKIPASFGIDSVTGQHDRRLVNAYFWIDRSGLLRVAIIPRRAHRPKCYAAEGDAKFIVSPGAIDMTGLIVAPRREDYDRIDSYKCREIYSEVAFESELPAAIKKHFGI